MVGVIKARGYPDSEEIGSVEVRVVQGVYVGAKAETEGVGEVAPRLDLFNEEKVGLEGFQAVSIDGFLIEIGGVEISDLLFFRSGSGIGSSRGFNNAGDAFIDDVGEIREPGDRGAVGGDLGMCEIVAVRVFVPVVSGDGGGIHAGRVDAVRILRCGGSHEIRGDEEDEC
jgi:hypothetical protein